MSTAPGPVRRWVLAARIRTLPAALVPVIAGTSTVIHNGRHTDIKPLNTILAAFISLALQVGTNYANDYSDGIKGTDERRVGPFRLTASKLVPAAHVKYAAFAFFGMAAVAGLFLASRVTWWLVPIGFTAIVAGWFYTGGPKPYGYYGLGEFFVFIYFGLVATLGTADVQCGPLSHWSWFESVAVGLAAVCLLEANNIRDIDGDRESGKKTIAARLGRERAGRLYVATVVGVLIFLFLSGLEGDPLIAALAALFVAVGYRPAIKLALSQSHGRELLPMLAESARAQLMLGLALLVVNVAR